MLRLFACSKGILTLLLSVFLGVVSDASFSGQVEKRAPCPGTLQAARTLADALQGTFWDGSGYRTGIPWTDANTYEDLNNLMLGAGIDAYSYVNSNSTLAKRGLANAGNWDNLFQGSFDDAQWVILSFYKMADYRASKGQDISALMGSASAIYDYVAAEWDDKVCGGGVWWSSARNYKNAVTNELFLLTSANGYMRTKNQTYLDNAKKTWSWLSKSGMRNAQGLFNDGLDTMTCKNNGQTTWTYNQGVIASGLANLGVATNDHSLFDQAEISLDAAIKYLTVSGILKEPCDNAMSPQGQCNHNEQIFKGIFTKHLQYYLDMVNDPARTAKYRGFLSAQQSAVSHFGKNADNIVGSVWYAKKQGGSVFTAETATSGIAATLPDAKYGQCQG